MTAIAARFGPDAPDVHAADIARMLAAMSVRGADALEQWTGDGSAAGVARFAWEIPAHSPAAIVHRRHITVVADATLYYRDDLRAAIAAANGHVDGDSATALILAAYDAFGDACVDRLEGDFAFIVWDEQQRHLLAARDFVGKRTLYFAERDDRMSIASTVGGVASDRRVPGDLNLGAIAAGAAGLWVNTNESCYTAIRELPAGFMLRWSPGGRAHASRFWHPPQSLDPRPSSMEDGAQELRALLTRAVDERMPHSGTTAVTLSGGWDSTAVFGAGQNALRENRAGRTLGAVSISYPEGDPGREDELIGETASYWHTQPEWIDINDVHMFDGARAAVATRDDPFSHPYEPWHNALAHGARKLGARVMLDGAGGDQLFQVSGVRLADLFRSGRWLQLRAQWRATGEKGMRTFLQAAVRPALSERTLRVIAKLRGKGTPLHTLDREPAPWFREEFLRSHGVIERERASRPPLPESSAMLAETHAYLLLPFFPRITGRVFAFAMRNGVESRSPLLDARVVKFAVPRPWYERADRKETKILLRRSMKDLLPDRILAARTHRTGITSGYFDRSVRGPGREFIESALDVPVMASAGMVDPQLLRKAWEYFLRSGDQETGVRVYYTIQSELWLQLRSGASSRPARVDVASEKAPG